MTEREREIYIQYYSEYALGDGIERERERVYIFNHIQSRPLVLVIDYMRTNHRRVGPRRWNRVDSDRERERIYIYQIIFRVDLRR